MAGWNPDGNLLRRVYEFRFLPPGLFSRFIVRLLAVSTARHYWRTGVILSSSSNTAALVMLEGTNRVKVSIYGPDSSRLLALLDSTLRSLAKHACGIEARVSAVCACVTCMTSANPYLWDLLQVARNTFEQHGCVLRCPTTAQPVDAAQMLPDVALAELVQLLVGPPELVLERKAHLGEGGFSVVFRGTLRGKLPLFCFFVHI